MTWVELVDDLSRCTDCGLCLSACPTFVTDRLEGESPRGRVHLLRLAVDGTPDDIATAHLAGCLECGACHEPCPTGVRVAVARRLHRAGTDGLDRPGFERRAEDLAVLLAEDAGTALVVTALRAPVAPPAPNGRFGGTTVVPVWGPLLCSVAPHLVTTFAARLGESGVAWDPALAAALERAGGLLGDGGLFDEHDAAVAAALELVADPGHGEVTVAVFDWLYLRLRELPLPPSVRILPAYDVFPVVEEVSGVWDHPPGADPPPTALAAGGYLPARHYAAGSPVPLTAPAVRAANRLVVAKREWLSGRRLVTMDARSLVRFPGARHVAEYLKPALGAREPA